MGNRMSRNIGHALIHDHKLAADSRALETQGAAEVRRAQWEQAVRAALARLSAAARTGVDTQRKSAGWKVSIATYLKAATEVSNGWLAVRLDMGLPVYMSKHLGLLQREIGKGRRWLDLLEKGKV